MFVKAKGIRRICGDYCAWHEASIYVEYVFGDLFFIGDEAYDYLIEKLELDWSDDDILEKQDKVLLDKLVKEYMEDFERENCDKEIADCVVEVNDNGKVLEVYF